MIVATCGKSSYTRRGPGAIACIRHSRGSIPRMDNTTLLIIVLLVLLLGGGGFFYRGRR